MMMRNINVKLALVQMVRKSKKKKDKQIFIYQFYLFCLICFHFKGQPAIRSRYAQLTILVPPEPPKIAQGDFILAHENQEIELDCESVGGKPAAQVLGN